ncbi:MAG: hypothetical protein M3Y73_12575, partial [Actinomycetota bacterium]|nr:hypothetical protein [Actinomycetota bacterium]
MPTHPRHQGHLVICLQVLGNIATRVERQVHVGVDQARPEADIAQFDQRQLHQGVGPGEVHVNDATTLDHHQRHPPVHDLPITINASPLITLQRPRRHSGRPTGRSARIVIVETEL